MEQWFAIRIQADVTATLLRSSPCVYRARRKKTGPLPTATVILFKLGSTSSTVAGCGVTAAQEPDSMADRDCNVNRPASASHAMTALFPDWVTVIRGAGG